MATIRITSPCDLYPFTPHFYIVKVRFTGVYIFFILALKHRLWVLVRTASVTIYVLRKNKKYHNFSSKNYHLWKFKKYLHDAWVCLRNDALPEVATVAAHHSNNAAAK